VDGTECGGLEAIEASSSCESSFLRDHRIVDQKAERDYHAPSEMRAADAFEVSQECDREHQRNAHRDDTPARTPRLTNSTSTRLKKASRSRE